PLWQMRLGVSPVIPAPSNKIVPPSGGYSPAMQLNVVLLPDPFGPIRPRISPSFTSNDTLLTARSAPKRLVRPVTLNIAMQKLSARLVRRHAPRKRGTQ